MKETGRKEERSLIALQVAVALLVLALIAYVWLR